LKKKIKIEKKRRRPGCPSPLVKRLEPLR
jgi:hypothetical protein